MTNIVTVLQQLNDLSETQILLIEEYKKLRERVAMLEARPVLKAYVNRAEQEAKIMDEGAASTND